MLRKRLRRPTLIAACAVALAGVAAGAVLAARFDVPGDPTGLDRSLQAGEMAKVADVPDAKGASSRSVFVEHAGGLLCLWDAPSSWSRTRQGGCNPESRPLGDGDLFVSFSYDGGPEAEAVRDARLVGLTSTRVARVDVVLSDGTVRELRPRPAPAAGDGLEVFVYRMNTGDLHRGIGPVAVRAFDANGREVDRKATGFTE